MAKRNLSVDEVLHGLREELAHNALCEQEAALTTEFQNFLKAVTPDERRKYKETYFRSLTPDQSERQRRTLLYRYSSRGFDGGNGAGSGVGERQSESFHDTSGFRGGMSPLGQAILEPAHLGNRPDIAALLAEEEQGGGG